MRKRILSTLLVLCMVLAMLPGTALAANVAFGTCGDNAKWSLSSDGTITISGTGKMSGYNYGASPWFARREEIKKIVVRNGITEIGDRDFSMCTKVTNVSIPATVEKIGWNSFEDCGKLTATAFGGTVNQWNSIDIEKSNYGILFSAENKITYAGSKNTTTILSGQCGVSASWTLSSTGTLTISGKGKMSGYNYGGAPWFARREEIKKIVVSDGITEIGDRDFSMCTKVTNVSIPATVEKIGWNSFEDCNKLTVTAFGGAISEWNSIDIEKSNYGILFSAENRITYGGSQGTSTILSGQCGTSATWTLSSDGTLTISGKGKMSGYNYGGSPWFARREEIKKIVVSSGITEIGDRNFSMCTKVVSAFIPAAVERIGWNAFESCEKLQTVYYGGTEDQWTDIDIDKSNNAVLYSANTRIIANYVESYTVTFNPNGGTVATKTKSVTNGKTYGTLPTPTRSGYKFNGWYTKSSGGTKVTSATKVNLTGNQTLYAQWTKSASTTTKTCKVTLNANGGTVSKTSLTVTQGKTYGTLPTPTRAGYKFDGWYTAKTSGSKVTSATKVPASSTQTLYARWSRPKTYFVTFDPNGGTVLQDYASVASGAIYRSLPTPVRPGYHFTGWYTKKTGGTKVTPTTRVSLTGDTTLYARWSTAAVSVTRSQSGTWKVTVPAGYKLVLHSSNVSAAQASAQAASSSDRSVTCTRMVTLSNGTVRYYAKFGTSYYWFTYTHEMAVN